jgi:hypothetical protein
MCTSLQISIRLCMAIEGKIFFLFAAMALHVYSGNKACTHKQKPPASLRLARNTIVKHCTGNSKWSSSSSEPVLSFSSFKL